MSAVGQPLCHVTGNQTVSAVGEHRRPARPLRRDACGWCRDGNGRELAQVPGDNGPEGSGRGVTPSIVVITHGLCTYRFWICEFVYLPKCVCYLKIDSCGAFVVNCGHVQRGENSEPTFPLLPSLCTQRPPWLSGGLLALGKKLPVRRPSCGATSQVSS